MTRHKTNEKKKSPCQAMCVKQNLATRWIVSKNKQNKFCCADENKFPPKFFNMKNIYLCLFGEMIEIGLRTNKKKRQKF